MSAIFDGSPRRRCDEAQGRESKTLSLLYIVCDLGPPGTDHLLLPSELLKNGKGKGPR
jgi:hypothetical protein